jgi:hypothetical protein
MQAQSQSLATLEVRGPSVARTEARVHDAASRTSWAFFAGPPSSAQGRETTYSRGGTYHRVEECESTLTKGRSPISIADLLKAGLLRDGQELYLRRDESKIGYIAKDGSIVVEGTKYANPTGAAKATGSWKTVKGWTAWSVECNGRRIQLADLRSMLK